MGRALGDAHKKELPLLRDTAEDSRNRHREEAVRPTWRSIGQYTAPPEHPFRRTGSDKVSRVKVTAYFAAMRQRPDRAIIRDEWILRAVARPIREYIQADGRIRRWTPVPEMGNRYLRVVLLSDGETVHNAFFDRGFEP